MLLLLLQIETIRANVIGCLNLADVCLQKGLHMMYYGTGCIFHYDNDKFVQGNGVGFHESDTPNFTGSYYSYTKAMVESLLKVCTVCALRSECALCCCALCWQAGTGGRQECSQHVSAPEAASHWMHTHTAS